MLQFGSWLVIQKRACYSNVLASCLQEWRKGGLFTTLWMQCPTSFVNSNKYRFSISFSKAEKFRSGDLVPVQSRLRVYFITLGFIKTQHS